MDPSTNVPQATSGSERGSCFFVLAVLGVGAFALIVGWNGIINPPPKPTPEQLREVQRQRQTVENQLMSAVREAEAQSTPSVARTQFHVSDGTATEKFARAQTLPPNWATQECVDIVVRYPSAPEAARAADMLIDKWDHILHRDFLKLTGERLPVDYDPSRDEVVGALKAAFQSRGIPTSR